MCSMPEEAGTIGRGPESKRPCDLLPLQGSPFQKAGVTTSSHGSSGPEAVSRLLPVQFFRLVRPSTACTEGSATWSLAASNASPSGEILWSGHQRAATVSFADFRSTELGPAMIVKVPGSTTRFISMFQKERSSGVIEKVTV